MYAGGFVDHYITGVIYPEKLAPLVQGLIAAAVVVGYTGLLRSRRHAGAKFAEPPQARATPERSGGFGERRRSG